MLKHMLKHFLNKLKLKKNLIVFSKNIKLYYTLSSKPKESIKCHSNQSHTITQTNKL